MEIPLTATHNRPERASEAALVTVADSMRADWLADHTHADKGVEVAMNISGASDFRKGAFKRFSKSVNEGCMLEFVELMTWQREAKKKAAAEKTTPQAKE